MKVLGASSWSVGGADADLAALPRLPDGAHLAPEPPRPDAVPAGTWRRMSRVARLAATVTAPLVPLLDPDRTALLWGTMGGEFGSTAPFLRSLFQKGPAGASPLSFQNSVHNAPAGHLSIAFGLRGPSETLCAGPLTPLRLLERADAWLARRGGTVLIVAADDLGPDVRDGYTLAGVGGALGEGAAALLLTAGDGLRLEPGDGDWGRAQRFPEETRGQAGEGHDIRVGLYGAVDLVAVAYCTRAGGSVGMAGTRACC